jgi:hypothetical protein
MKRVFISFCVEDLPRVTSLLSVAADATFDVELHAESAPIGDDSSNDLYIRRNVRNKINRTSVTLCMLSSLTHTSDWVRWQLDQSIERGNSIILMGFPNGPAQLQLPAPVQGRAWWPWDPDRLQRMIQSAP